MSDHLAINKRRTLCGRKITKKDILKKTSDKFKNKILYFVDRDTCWDHSEDCVICKQIFENATTEITITINTQSLFDIHKLTIKPSVAVNPPAIQYFSGVKRNWSIDGGSNSNNNRYSDNRFDQMKAHIITMLSSNKHPNPPICSKRTATRVADDLLPKLLKQITSTSKDINIGASKTIPRRKI